MGHLQSFVELIWNYPSERWWKPAAVHSVASRHLAVGTSVGVCGVCTVPLLAADTGWRWRHSVCVNACVCGVCVWCVCGVCGWVSCVHGGCARGWWGGSRVIIKRCHTNCILMHSPISWDIKWPRRGDLPSVDRPIIITGHDRIGFRTWRMECYGKPLEDGTYGNLTAMPHAWNIAIKLHKCCTLETSWWNECSGCSTWGTACNWDTHRYNKPLQDDTCSDDTITTRPYMMLGHIWPPPTCGLKQAGTAHVQFTKVD